MNKWKSVPLGELVDIVGGGTPTRSNSSYYGGTIPWVTPKDMKSWEIVGAQLSITKAGLDNSATKLVPPNSVLVVVRSGVLKHTIPVALNRLPVTINQDMKALQCRESVNPDYLARFVKARSSEILQWVRATTADNFPIDKLKALLVPLPDAAQQRRIAEVLDRAEALRAKRRAALAQLDSLTQAIFIEMFGDPVTNEREWPLVSIGDFVAGFESGKSVVADDVDDVSCPYRVLKVSAVTSLEYLPGESKALPFDYKPPASHFVHKGDLLFSRANTSELIGATALVHDTPPNILMPDKLWRFVWHDLSRAEPRYVLYLFQQPKFRSEIGKRATGTSGSMKNISQEKVLSIRVGHPPLSLQQEFSRRIAAVEKLKAAQHASLAQLDALFASLQHRAFRGEL